MTITLDGASAPVGMSLSNGSLTVTRQGGNSRMYVIANTALTASCVWEVTYTTITAFEARGGVASDNSSRTAFSEYVSDGNWYDETGNIGGSGAAGWNPGDTEMFAWDHANKKLWSSKDGSTWFAGSGANPATSTGGIAYSGATAYPSISLTNNLDSATINFGATGFVHSPPAGFPSMVATLGSALSALGTGTVTGASRASKAGAASISAVMAAAGVAASLAAGVGFASGSAGGGGFDDGSAGQPTSGIQLPSALVPYSNAAVSWRAPGIHYYVGPAPGTVFKDIVANPPADFDVILGSKYIRPNKANAWLDGYDLQDWQIYNPDQPFMLVSNCKFGVGPTVHQPVYIPGPPGPVSFLYCLFDGQKSHAGTDSSFDAIINGSPNGAYTIRYCEFKNVYDDVIQISSGGGSYPLNIEYNLIRNNGYGIGVDAISVHPDWIQVFGATRWAASIRFNTFVMDDATLHPTFGGGSRGIATQGLFLSEGYFTSLAVTNNIMLLTVAPTDGIGGTGTVSQIFMVNVSQCATPPQILNNFIDATGIGVQVYNLGLGDGTYSTSVAYVGGNTNLLTGAVDQNSGVFGYGTRYSIIGSGGSTVGVGASTAAGAASSTGTGAFTGRGPSAAIVSGAGQAAGVGAFAGTGASIKAGVVTSASIGSVMALAVALGWIKQPVTSASWRKLHG